MPSPDLAAAVGAFASTAVRVPEARMTDELAPSDAPEDSPWSGYGSIRELCYRVYQDLRQLAARTAAARAHGVDDITPAQRILAQHHAAWRDLCGALAGVGDDELDRAPAAGEWPLRTVIEHMFDAEQGFRALVRYALERGRRHPEWPDRPADRGAAFGAGAPVDVSGGLADILARFEALHADVLERCATITDAELAWPSRFWEGYDLPIAFRLQRFDTHLREHTIQVDKTLRGIGHAPTEAERLTRLIYAALGEAEGAAIGSNANDAANVAQAATIRGLGERLNAAVGP